MNQVASFLEQMTEAFKPPMIPTERLVFRFGKEFPGHALPSKYKRGRPKECFNNAMNVSIYHDIRYVEGFALSPKLIPVAHAWCLDKDGRVIDVTWNKPEHCEYFGIIIPKKLLIQQVLKNNMAGVLDDWRNNWEFHSVLEKSFTNVVRFPEEKTR
jgi:hypothetical protein